LTIVDIKNLANYWGVMWEEKKGYFKGFAEPNFTLERVSWNEKTNYDSVNGFADVGNLNLSGNYFGSTFFISAS